MAVPFTGLTANLTGIFGRNARYLGFPRILGRRAGCQSDGRVARSTWNRQHLLEFGNAIEAGLVGGNQVVHRVRVAVAGHGRNQIRPGSPGEIAGPIDIVIFSSGRGPIQLNRRLCHGGKNVGLAGSVDGQSDIINQHLTVAVEHGAGRSGDFNTRG